MKSFNYLSKRILSGILALALVLSGSAFGSLSFYQEAAAASYVKVPFSLMYYLDSSKTSTASLGTMYLYYPVSHYGSDVSMTESAFYFDEECTGTGYTLGAAVGKHINASLSFADGIVTDETGVTYSNGILDFTDYYAQSTMTASVSTPIKLYGTLTSKIMLDNQSATTPGTGSIRVQYGESSIPSIEIPTRTGYTFKGYYSASDGKGTQYISSNGTPLSSFTNRSFRSDTTLYAYWTADTYGVSLDNQSATTAGTTEVTTSYGTAMPSISVPTKTGYTFGGYFAGSNGSGTQYYTSSGTSARTWDRTTGATLYAKWTANTYTVTLDNQSATSAGSSRVTATYDLGMPAITVPTKTGYQFGGYFTGTGGSGMQYYTSSGASARSWNKTADTTLYAYWTVNTYNVTIIDRCGTSVLDTKEFPFQYGQTVFAGDILGSSTIIGAYHSDYKLSSCSFATVTGNCTIYRDFVSYKGCGLNDSMISGDGKTLVSAGKDVTNVTVPSSVITIADNAFKDCTALKTVTIPNNSVTSVGKNAFQGCRNLSGISLPYSVMEIGTGAFDGCINLGSITVKNPACVIGDNKSTIPGNTEIKAFKASTGVTYAKQHSRNLETITEIGKDFFSNETTMVSFDIPDNVITIDKNAFKNCTNLKEITLGNVRTIGDDAFINTKISSVTIPDDTISVGKNAFSDCTRLTEVVFEADSKLESIGNYAFARNVSLRYGTCTTPSEGSNDTTFYLPPTVTNIGSYAFLGCNNLGQVDVTGMTTSFGDEVFHKDTVVGAYAGSDAFYYADENSYKIALWSGYETNRSVQMEDREYQDNTNIYSAGFGEYQTEISSSAFNGCSEMIDVVYSKHLERIEAQAFSKCTRLGSCMSQDETTTDWGLSYIGNGAFAQCSSLKSLNIYNPNCEIIQEDEQVDSQTAVTIPVTTTVNAWSKSTAFDYCNMYGLIRNPIGTSYQIIFDKNGGINGTDKIYAYTGMDWPDIDISAKTGYTFSGYSHNGVTYYDEEGCASLTGDAMNINSDMMGNSALAAQWTANCYKISYDANGGVGVMADTDMIYDVPEHLKENQFTRTGYTFAGWNTESEGTGTAYADMRQVSNLTSTLNGTVTLYAQWKPISYMITFDINGGNGDIPSDIEALYGVEYAIASADPEREDYIFTGWNTKADGTGFHYDAEAVVKNLTSEEGATVILYADFAAISYDITYDLGGGRLTGEERNPEIYTANDEITLINPTKKGYSFVGWTGTEVEGVSTDVTIPVGSRGDRSYVAHWSKDTYHITYDLAGGNLGDGQENPQTYTVDTEAFELYIPTKTGHIFLGWQEKEDHELSVYYTVAKGTTGNLEFTAKWKPITYTVNLDTDGGTFDEDSDNITSYVYGEGATLPTKLTKEGYLFCGWSETEDGSESVTEISPVAMGDKTFYAIWRGFFNSFCTIHYMDGEAELGPASIDNYKDSINVVGCKEKPGAKKLPSVVTKEGYTFAGWYEDKEFSGEALTEFVYYGESDDSADGEKYFYAKWTANTYDVSYILNGGISKETLIEYYVYGKGMILPNDMEKEGYIFGGWYENPAFDGEPLTEISSTDIGAKTCYAKWIPRSYKINYHLNEGKFGNSVNGSYTYGKGMELPTDVIRNGCQFEGWYDNKDYKGNAVQSISGADMGDKTYYAKWSPRTYHITYVLDGGEINDTEYVTNYLYNTSASLPVNVTKENCQFEGWYDNPGFEGSAVTQITSVTYGNRTYYAKFVKTSGTDQKPSQSQEQPQATSPSANNSGVGGQETPTTTIYTTKVMGGVTYQVTDGASRAVTISKTASSDDTKVTIPAKVSIKGVSYKVTRIEDDAFKGWKNLQTVSIGKNVEKIGKRVFQGDGKLKKITIKSKKLKKVGGKTLKGVNKRLKIYVPKARVKKYKKLFKGKGQKKSVKVLAKK